MEIINCVARLREATKDQIRKEVGFSSDYIGFLCQYLVRKGYLKFSNGGYSLAKEGMRTLLSAGEVNIDRKLLEEVAAEIVRLISDQLKKRVEGIKLLLKIKTDFAFPIEDESLSLESNIYKIGPKVEKEKSDIDRLIKLFKEVQKGGVRDD